MADLLSWAFAVGALSFAVVAALNLFGLARGRLLTTSPDRVQNLAFVMMGVGIGGFFWAPGGDGDALPEPWRFYWIGLGMAGLVVLLAQLLAPEIRRWYRRGTRVEGDALFFLRMHTDRKEWRPKHFAILAAFAASVMANLMVPNSSWWTWAALIWLLAMLESLRLLPVHHGRREPTAKG